MSWVTEPASSYKRKLDSEELFILIFTFPTSIRRSWITFGCLVSIKFHTCWWTPSSRCVLTWLKAKDKMYKRVFNVQSVGNTFCTEDRCLSMSPVIFATSLFKPAISLVTASFRVESSLLMEWSADITSYMDVHGKEWIKCLYMILQHLKQLTHIYIYIYKKGKVLCHRLKFETFLRHWMLSHH